MNSASVLAGTDGCVTSTFGSCATSATAVLDHHRLAEVVLQRRHEAARGDIGAAARGRGDDEVDRLRRVLRRRRRNGERRGKQHEGKNCDRLGHREASHESKTTKEKGLAR